MHGLTSSVAVQQAAKLVMEPPSYVLMALANPLATHTIMRRRAISDSCPGHSGRKKCAPEPNFSIGCYPLMLASEIYDQDAHSLASVCPSLLHEPLHGV